MVGRAKKHRDAAGEEDFAEPPGRGGVSGESWTEATVPHVLEHLPEVLMAGRMKLGIRTAYVDVGILAPLHVAEPVPHQLAGVCRRRLIGLAPGP